jgi:hypothetical protein
MVGCNRSPRSWTALQSVLAASWFYRRSVQAEDRLGYARYLPCRRSKSHNVDIGLAPRVVKGFISDVRVHQFGFPFANRVQYRFPLSMSIHLQLEHTRRNGVTEPVTRASCKPHFHIPTWIVRVPPASHFITVERASTLHLTCYWFHISLSLVSCRMHVRWLNWTLQVDIP